MHWKFMKWIVDQHIRQYERMNRPAQIIFLNSLLDKTHSLKAISGSFAGWHENAQRELDMVFTVPNSNQDPQDVLEALIDCFAEETEAVVAK